jgi:hypothetical protein
MKTQITDIQRFRNTLKKARELGGESRLSLINCLKRLNEIRRNRDYKLVMSPDFVAHSWSFGIYRKDGILSMNGGLILHGFEETFSVELDGASYPHWSLHT